MITFQSVTKRFGEMPPALEDVSFHVEPGEFVFLTGPSGSGKTTLLKILIKEYIPTEGDVEFQGKLLSKMKGSQIHNHRRSIGVVFQDYRLLSDLNVWENIALALQIAGKKQAEIEERVTDLLELVQLTDHAYHFPAQLSGGESQRIGIARALATAPALLLADEPTGNLDPQNSMMIARLFDRINQLGTTVILATHDESILNSFKHRKILLEKGKLMKDSGGKKVEIKKEEKLEVKEKDKPEIKSEPKKPFFRLPKFSLPFGKKKKAGEITPKAATTEINQKETEKQKTEEPAIKLKKPIIEQENLDGSKEIEPKKSASPQPVVEVETLQAMIKEKK